MIHIRSYVHKCYFLMGELGRGGNQELCLKSEVFINMSGEGGS